MSTDNFNGFIEITDHALLLLKGKDAHKFLQGQVTCDINSLSFSETKASTEFFSCLGAHCNHKGRMAFSFRACQIDEETIALSIYEPLVNDALLALKKYSVFSKVELINGSQDFTLYGFAGDDKKSLLDISTHLPSAVNKVTHNAKGTIIQVGLNRYEYWMPNDSANKASLSTSNHDLNTWQLLNIADGIGEVRSETVEEFIPQMLNFQDIGDGISFTKGCYTGQEVVARMQYLGKLKKRMYRFTLNYSSLIAPGTPLYTSENSNAVGTVVLSAIADDKQELLAVVNKDAADRDNVYLDSTFKQKLQALTLPYAITKE